MKRLLNTLFVMTTDSYLTLDGENVVVVKDDEQLGRFPLHTLEGIVYFGYKGASPALMGSCVSHDISLSFMTPSGRFLARVSGASRGNVLLRKAQYRVSDSEEQSGIVARAMTAGKIYNSRWVLERMTRDHAMRLDIAPLKAGSLRLREAAIAAARCDSLDTLRGIEGEAAADYFSVFDDLILQNKHAFRFEGRNRRPPLDRVNALLSLSYTVLANDCAAALESVGLDAYVGFLHRDKPGRASLALDLMEELRPAFADRFVLSCINNRILQPELFTVQEGGAVMLTEDGRRAFFKAYQERKKEQLTHPFLGEKISWGLVPYVQSLLLARTLRGDLDAYPPFLWK